MKKLEEKFKSRGFIHKQLRREGNRAIYQRYAAKSDPATCHYEVVKINSHGGYKLGNSYIVPAETYPSSSMWGRCGWTCDTEEQAEIKFDELGKYE